MVRDVVEPALVSFFFLYTNQISFQDPQKKGVNSIHSSLLLADFHDTEAKKGGEGGRFLNTKLERLIICI